MKLKCIEIIVGEGGSFKATLLVVSTSESIDVSGSMVITKSDKQLKVGHHYDLDLNEIA